MAKQGGKLGDRMSWSACMGMVDLYTGHSITRNDHTAGSRLCAGIFLDRIMTCSPLINTPPC